MQFSGIAFDEEGIISFREEDRFCHNPFLVALQAVIGEYVLNDYYGKEGMLIPRYFCLEDLEDPTQCPVCRRAMEWLIAHAVSKGDACLWAYDFDGAYNGTQLTTPWYSAYGQAYVILALLQWSRFDEQYQELLEKAVKGLLLSVGSGGCMLEMEDGVWFEEIVGSECTHIFNAHLISLIALLQVKERQGYEWLENPVDRGLRAFYQLMDRMDTGINSAYDSKKKYDCMWQLVPEDMGRQIRIRALAVSDEEGERELELSGMECFEVKDRWIAGIDWGVSDEEGYRPILQGEILHPEAVPGGERQNTFAYFKNVTCSDDCFTLRIDYKTEQDTALLLFKNCAEAGYQPLGYVSRVELPAEKQTARVRIPFSALAEHVPQMYHKYHIQLLEELDRLLPDFKGRYLIDKFRNYRMEQRLREFQRMQEPPILKGLSVSVNEQCGLYCKMCDLGIQNRNSSMFYYMKNEQERKELELDILVDRCREALGELEVVQIIGTEPTLWLKLPEAVATLTQLGVKVLVTTNGINLKNMLRPLVEAGLSELDISIDGPHDVHDEIRGKNGLFREIMLVLEENRELLDSAIPNGFQLRIGVAITPMNYRHLSELLDEIKGTPVRSVWCTHMNYITEETAARHTAANPRYPIGASCTHPDMDPTLVNPWLMYRSLADAKRLAAKDGIELICVPALEDYEDYWEFYHSDRLTEGCSPLCRAPFRTMQVNSNGSICVMSRCYQFEIGNIYQNSLHDIFYSRSMMEFRECVSRGLWDPCKRCCAIM